MNTEQNRPRNSIGIWGTASTMGMHMISGPLVGGALGWLADDLLGTWPWGAGIGLLLGFAAGFRLIYEDSHSIINAQDEDYRKGTADEDR